MAPRHAFYLREFGGVQRGLTRRQRLSWHWNSILLVRAHAVHHFLYDHHHLVAAMDGEDQSLLDKLDALAPESIKSFDAFPKLPATYKSRSESRGFLTVFVAFLAFLLVLNDIGEFIWGWPDQEFAVDRDDSSFMNVNVDLVVNMPCRCEFLLSSRAFSLSYLVITVLAGRSGSVQCNRNAGRHSKTLDAGRPSERTDGPH